MTQPDLFYSNDITMITGVAVNYATSTPTPYEYCWTAYHAPVFGLCLVVFVVSIIFDRLFIEFLRRIRKK